jgi:hypothetical protein
MYRMQCAHTQRLASSVYTLGEHSGDEERVHVHPHLLRLQPLRLLRLRLRSAAAALAVQRLDARRHGRSAQVISAQVGTPLAPHGIGGALSESVEVGTHSYMLTPYTLYTLLTFARICRLHGTRSVYAPCYFC